MKNALELLTDARIAIDAARAQIADMPNGSVTTCWEQLGALHRGLISVRDTLDTLIEFPSTPGPIMRNPCGARTACPPAPSGKLDATERRIVRSRKGR